MKFQTLLITAACTTGTRVDDARGLCPSGWHVPTDGEFMTLEMELGMSESEANGTGWRGTDQGTQMKSSASDSPAWNGTNTSGFSGLAGGYRSYSGDFSMKATTVISGRLRLTVQALGTVILNGGSTEVDRTQLPTIRFFSSLRSGLKTRACGGLDPLIL